MEPTDVLLKTYYRVSVPMKSGGIGVGQVDARLKCLDINRSGRITEDEVWRFTAQNEFAVQNLISLVNACGKDIDKKAGIISVLSKIGGMGLRASRLANSAIIAFTQGPCEDKLMSACIDAIGKMPYSIARPNLLRIREQYGPFKRDISPASRRRASLLLLDLDIARHKTARKNSTEATLALFDLGLIIMSAQSLSHPVNIKDIRQVSEFNISKIKSALRLLGRISDAQAYSKDRDCVVRALDALRNDYPSGRCSRGKYLDLQTLRLLAGELKKLV